MLFPERSSMVAIIVQIAIAFVQLVVSVIDLWSSQRKPVKPKK